MHFDLRADTSDMQIKIECQPSYALAYVTLEHGEAILADRGAMALMSEGIEASGAVHGGITKAFLRKQFGEENFVQAKYTAQVHGAWVAVAPPFPGDITEVELFEGQSIFAESGSVLAHADTIEASVKYSGVKTIALHEGATVLRLKGVGKALLASYGGIQKMHVPENQAVIVDTGHLVAWSDTCKLNIGVLGNVITTQLTGEGLVGRLTGPGDVWIQTRAEQGIKGWLLPGHEQNTGRGSSH